MTGSNPPRSNDDPTRVMSTTNATGTGGATGGTTSDAWSGSASVTGGTVNTSGSTTTYSPHGAGSGSLSETEFDASDDTASGSMSERAGEMKDKATEMAGTAKDKVSDMTGTAKDKVTDVAGTAKEKLGGATQTVDAQRDTVAGGLDTVATQLRDRAETIPGGERTTQLATTAADKIETASSYLRENEVSDMMSDVERFVRQRPTESLVIALAAGFLLGRAIKG